MLSIVLFIFFFFKQKTAYEVRISDWSSVVCSSYLLAPVSPRVARRTDHVEACAIPVNSLALSHSTEFVSNGAVIRTILAHIKHGHYVRVMTESIGYIFAGIARLMRRRFDEMSRETGITSPQWRGEREGGGEGKSVE